MLVFVWLVATALATGFVFLADEARAFPTLLESAFHLAWLGILGPRLLPFFAPLGAGTKRVLLFVLGAGIFGQLAGQSTWTYPAVQWGMYSVRPEKTLETFEYFGHLRSGSVRKIEPLEAYPSLGSFRLAYLLQDLATAALKPDARPDIAPIWRNTVASLGVELNRLDATDPVVSIDVVRTRIDGDLWTPDREGTRETILQVPVP